jgi:probable addiction module antidote protein
MRELAKDTGITRGALYAALREGGDPALDAVLKVLNAISVRLAADPVRNG